MIFNLPIQSWFWLVVSILAVWRATTLLCYEAGPFKIMNSFRKAMYRMKLGSLIECFHCTAMWVSIFFAIAFYETKWQLFLMALAIAGGASVIEKILQTFTHYYHANNNDE